MEKTLAAKLGQMGFTSFQIKVLEETSKIPKGQVRTYKDIAKAAGSPKAYRAVGTVLKNNPFPITIPCHRVIKSSGELGMYSGKSGKRKEELLNKEGVRTQKGKIAAKSIMHK
ncbi:MAG: MGMT family protein [Methanothrix sp.]